MKQQQKIRDIKIRLKETWEYKERNRRKTYYLKVTLESTRSRVDMTENGISNTDNRLETSTQNTVKKDKEVTSLEG